MARTGRPPVPNEIKRKRGTAKPSRTPALADVVFLRAAEGVPEPPAGLLREGGALWARIWSHGFQWISPDSDWAEVVEVCRLADDLSMARERYRATREPADGRIVATLSKSLTEALAVLCFNPAARARLGIAEVRIASKLEGIRASKAKHRA